MMEYTGNWHIWWMGSDSVDHDEDQSDEEAFHPNYIPQCFFIDGFRCKCE